MLHRTFLKQVAVASLEVDFLKTSQTLSRSTSNAAHFKTKDYAEAIPNILIHRNECTSRQP